MDPARAHALNRPLATARVVLEPMTAAHADALFAPLQDPAIYEWIWLAPPVSLAALRERWGALASRVSPDGGEAWLNWVARRTADGACLGWVDASIVDATATNLGYVLVPAAWGQGYATELVRAVVAHLVACGVTRIVALVTAGNRASTRVLDKAGFAHTRVLPDNDTIRGAKVDDLEYVFAPMR